MDDNKTIKILESILDERLTCQYYTDVCNTMFMFKSIDNRAFLQKYKKLLLAHAFYSSTDYLNLNATNTNF